jgi:hypothetical protein
LNNMETHETRQHTEARRTRCGTKSLRCSVGRKSTPFLCTYEKNR